MSKPDGERKRRRPKRRWMDCIERNLRSLGKINWRSDEWRKFIRQVKTHEGLYATYSFLLLYEGIKSWQLFILILWYHNLNVREKIVMRFIINKYYLYTFII